MPKIYLDAVEQRYAAIWLKHTFLEIINDNPDNVYSWEFDSTDWNDSAVTKPFKEIWSIITNQAWDLDGKTNDYLDKISSISYSDKYQGKWYQGIQFKFSKEQIAAILIDMCSKCHLYWDDTKFTKQEKDYFIKNTIFGKVLADYDCFIGGGQQQNNQNNTTKQPTQSTRTSTPKAPKQPGQQNSFRARGPLSDQAIDLKGNPHDKTYIQASTLYKIILTNQQGGKEVRAFIRPLNSKFSVNGTNNVIIGNSNNYGDCTCLFETNADASAFMGAIENSQPNFSGQLVVAFQKVDSNGYFKVGTIFGDTYIRADNLNEELKEEADCEVIKRGTKEFDEMLREECKKLNDYLG